MFAGVFIWLFIEKKYTKPGGYCSNFIANCSSVNILMFFVNMLSYKILIVQEENGTVL